MNEVFYGIISADDKIRNMSKERIYEMMKSDNFVDIIFNGLEKKSNEDQTLMQILCICLMEYIKTCKNMSCQMHNKICLNIFNVVFDISSFECRKILMDIIKSLCIVQNIDIDVVLENCLFQINACDNSLINYASALYLLNEWFFLNFINQKFVNNKIEEFARELIPKLLYIVNKIKESDSLNLFS